MRRTRSAALQAGGTGASAATLPADLPLGPILIMGLCGALTSVVSSEGSIVSSSDAIVIPSSVEGPPRSHGD